MPQFYVTKKHHIVIYISGPSPVYLGLSLEGQINSFPTVIQKPAIDECCAEKLDKEQIRKAVLEGVTKGNSQFGTEFNVSEILYVENDSPNYELYKHCAYLLVKHRVTGGEFYPISE